MTTCAPRPRSDSPPTRLRRRDCPLVFDHIQDGVYPRGSAAASSQHRRFSSLQKFHHKPSSLATRSAGMRAIWSPRRCRSQQPPSITRSFRCFRLSAAVATLSAFKDYSCSSHSVRILEHWSACSWILGRTKPSLEPLICIRCHPFREPAPNKRPGIAAWDSSTIHGAVTTRGVSRHRP